MKRLRAGAHSLTHVQWNSSTVTSLYNEGDQYLETGTAKLVSYVPTDEDDDPVEIGKAAFTVVNVSHAGRNGVPAVEVFDFEQSLMDLYTAFCGSDELGYSEIIAAIEIA